MPGPSAFNRRFNTMPEKQGSVGARMPGLEGKKFVPPPAAPAKKKARRRPLSPPPVPPSGRVNPFVRSGRVNPFPTKRGSK